MAKTYDLTNGSPAKLIMKFFFPMFFTNMLQQIYTIADTAIVGKGLGDNQLAAVGNMSSLTFLIVGFSIGLTNGFSIMTAQYFGAGNRKNLRQCVAASTVLAFSITAVLTLLSIIFLRPVLVLLQTPESIISDSLIYGYIIFGGLAANIAYNLCASILRALGDSKTPFYAIIVSTITNIIIPHFTRNTDASPICSEPFSINDASSSGKNIITEPRIMYDTAAIDRHTFSPLTIRSYFFAPQF